MSNTSHRMFILKALQAGDEITPKDAVDRWNCWRPGARVYELRRMGIPIVNLNKNTKVRFACYFLKPEDRELEPNSPCKHSEKASKAITRDLKTGRFEPAINPLINQILDKAEVLYREGHTLREIARSSLGISYWRLREGLKARDVLRHRGQRKDNEQQLAFSELGGR